MSNILDKSVLDSKDYNDPNSVLYRGDLLESPDPQNKSTSQNNNNNKLIFVHGYLGFGSPEGGRNYWNSEFIQGGKEFVEANLDFFVDTEHSATSNTYERTRQGFSYAKKYYSQLINGMDKNKNKFSLISHSMGGAFSFGMAMYLMGQNWKIDSMFFF